MEQYRGAYNQGLLTDPMDMASFNPYAPLAAGLMFAPGSGVADVAGYAPSMTTAGAYEPSMMANIGSGRYMDAGLQGLGLLGDAFMAAGTVVPPLIPVGAAMKAPRAARVATKMGKGGVLSDVGEASMKDAPQSFGAGSFPLTKENLQKADETTKLLVSKILERNPDAAIGLTRSGSAAGPSNYISFMTPDGKWGQVRVSDHGTGTRRINDYLDQLPMSAPPEGEQVFGQISRKSFDDRINKIASLVSAPPRAAKVAGRMGDDVSETLLMQQPKKRPKIRQMPQAEQDLYAAAAAFELPRNVGEGLLLPQRAYEYGARTAEAGNQGLLIDPGFQNLSRDLPDLSGTVVRDLSTLAKSPTVDLQNLIGRTAKLMPGDMTMAGKEITHVMGVKLKNPVRMQGGKDFPAEKISKELGVVWASDPAVISGYAKQARENPGLLGVYTAMGARGGDFSHHVADVLVDMTKQAKKWLPESKVADFNEQIKNMKVKKFDPETGKETISTPFTDFPGITSSKIEKYMYSPGKGAARKAIADTMEKSSFRDAGFPDVTAVRQIVSDPSMSSRVNDPSGRLAPTGGRIVELDENPMLPMSGEGNIPEFHKTYRQAITGTDLGGLSVPVPRILMAPDFFAARRAGGKAPSSDRRSAEISNVLQVIRPEIADDVDVFQDYFNRGLLGRGF